MSFFLTIASASASFVAIIGGFIASKLISINGEREAVVTQIEELDEEIEYRTGEIEELQKNLDEDDALSFIDTNIDDLISHTDLRDVYKKNDVQRIDIDTLHPYWEKAVTLYKTYERDFCNAEFNDDGVPVTIVSKVINDKFAYDVCCKISFGLAENSTIWMMTHSSLKEAEASVKWYNQTSQQLDAVSRELDLLELQRKQLERQKMALVKPSNMSLGIYIFGGISLFNIFLPLLLCLLLPVYPKEIFDVFQIVCMVFMSLGLIFTFGYLINLLDWNPNKRR